MADRIRRRTTIERLAHGSARRLPNPLLLLPSVAFLFFLVSAAALVLTEPFMWVAGICTIAMVHFHSRTSRTPWVPGGVNVYTAPGEIVSVSQRFACGANAVGLAVVSLACGLAMALALTDPELSVAMMLPVIFIVPAIGIIVAIRSLIVVGRSVDVYLCVSDLTITAPLRRRKTLEWDSIYGATTLVTSRVKLFLASGSAVVIGTRFQNTDRTVLAELINRCAQHPIARQRLGDVILGDLLLNAELDGTEPAKAPRRDWS